MRTTLMRSATWDAKLGPMRRLDVRNGGYAIASWRTRRMLVAVEAIVGVGALYGGFELLRDAEGFGAKRAWLAGSVFPDYTVPGLVLIVVIGGGMLTAAVLTAFAGRYAAVSALTMGVVLLCWGTVETLTLGLVGGAQLTLLSSFVVAPGVALTLIGARGLRGARRLRGRAPLSSRQG
jgi:hypothetical protein